MELPIYQIKDDIIAAVKNNNVIIITAETGSGKSTQIPQMLLKELNLTSISTQPRRLACVSLFDRVKQEIGDSEVVGYKTAFEEEYTPDKNRILFVTDGLLVAAGSKCDYDCIIIDEVHEQSLNIEVLIAWAKLSLKNGNNKKFIFMSATLNTDILKNFFKDFNPVIINCPGSPHEIKTLYNNKVKPEVLAVDYAVKGKNVMMFLPGKKEIENMVIAIRNSLPSSDRYVIYQVHGDQTIDEQRPIFSNISPKVKIILCTNICQTSITVSDIDVVIDLGKAKIAEIEDGMKALVLKDISQSDCLQRKGRVGRTKPGIYILNSHTPLKVRPKYPIPEIQRMFLSEVVLKLASYNINIEELEFLHQPPKNLIKTAKEECISLGALTKDNELTDLGLRISLLPLNVKTAKMLITAEEYNKDVLDSVMKIAAIQQIGGLIYHGKNRTSYSKFTKEHNSDLLAEMDIFDYISANTRINFKDEGLNERNYLKAVEYYTKLKSMTWIMKNKYTGDTRKAVIECIIKSATKNDIFDFRTFDYDCELKKDMSSCVFGTLVLGTPKVIHFEKEVHNWYYDEEDNENTLPKTYHGELKLVTNLTKIHEKEIEKYFQNDIVEHLDVTINIFTDSFDTAQYMKYIKTDYMQIVFENSSIESIPKSHKLYKMAYESAYNHDLRVLKEGFLENRKISICGKEFYIHHLYMLNKNRSLKKIFSKLLDMRLSVKKMQFLQSKDTKNFLHIPPTIKNKMFPVIVLHDEDLLDEQFVEQTKLYEPIRIDDELLVFVKGNEYSHDLKKFI